jgi:hypothetical protein
MTLPGTGRSLARMGPIHDILHLKYHGVRILFVARRSTTEEQGADWRSPVNQKFEFVISFVVITLVLFGLGGISFNLFREDGWIEQIFGDIWEISIQYPLIAIPMIVGGALLGSMWRDHRIARGQRSKIPTYIVYLMMVAGIYYIWVLARTGSF